MRKNIHAHDGPILCIQWNHSGSGTGNFGGGGNPDASAHLLTGSNDATARIHSMTVGKTLKFFKGHTSYVQTCIYVPDYTKIVTGSADASIKVYDTKSCEAITTFHPPTPEYLLGGKHSRSGRGGKDLGFNADVGGDRGQNNQQLAVNQIILCPDSVDYKSNPALYVSTDCNQIYKMNLQGQVLKSYCSQKFDMSSEFQCISISKKAKYLFGITKDSSLYIFETATGKLVHILPEISSKEILGVACHPVRPGYLATWGLDCKVGLLRP